MTDRARKLQRIHQSYIQRQRRAKSALKHSVNDSERKDLEYFIELCKTNEIRTLKKLHQLTYGGYKLA